MYFTTAEDHDMIESNVDEYGDSYCCNVTSAELGSIFQRMPLGPKRAVQASSILSQFDEHGFDLEDLSGWMFRGMVVYFDWIDHDTDAEPATRLRMKLAEQLVAFGGGRASKDLDDVLITHIVVKADKSRLKNIRKCISKKAKIPRIVRLEWVEESWAEKTLLDEERFSAI